MRILLLTLLLSVSAFAENCEEVAKEVAVQATVLNGQILGSTPNCEPANRNALQNITAEEIESGKFEVTISAPVSCTIVWEVQTSGESCAIQSVVRVYTE